jgi:hypothetical protein
LPLASAGFLLGLLFDSEDGDNNFLQNVRLYELHDIMTCKTVSFIVSIVRTSNPKS